MIHYIDPKEHYLSSAVTIIKKYYNNLGNVRLICSNQSLCNSLQETFLSQNKDSHIIPKILSFDQLYSKMPICTPEEEMLIMSNIILQNRFLDIKTVTNAMEASTSIISLLRLLLTNKVRLNELIKKTLEVPIYLQSIIEIIEDIHLLWQKKIGDIGKIDTISAYTKGILELSGTNIVIAGLTTSSKILEETLERLLIDESNICIRLSI